VNTATAALAQMKKANKLVQLSFRKNGPKSYKRGQGALLNALIDNDGRVVRDDLIWMLGCDRSELKGIVKKAVRNGFATFEPLPERGYAVGLTPEGKAVAERRQAANDACAENIASCLTVEELAQLNAITEKLIVSCKEKGICGKGKGRKSSRLLARRA
jgi:DNA-binding MarR family transcriptional regulator